MADSDNDGPITREKKPKAETPAAEAPAAATPEAGAPASSAKAHDDGNCAGCARLRSALRENRKRLRRLIRENRTLQEELLSAGEIIEDLASDAERPM